MVRVSLSVVLLVWLAASPASAQENKSLVGTWRLVSYEVEAQATGQRGPIMGEKPTGYATFLPEGRVFFVLTGEGRKPAGTDQERAALLGTVIAYTGKYTLDRDKWTTEVEVAWNPEWVGTKQVRTFEIRDDRLMVTTPWRVMPNFLDKGTSRSIVTFERVK